MYDVIIIGAGPTGSSAAKKLADDGCNVLIVDRFKFPRNKELPKNNIYKLRQIV